MHKEHLNELALFAGAGITALSHLGLMSSYSAKEMRACATSANRCNPPIGYITKEMWPTPTCHMAKENESPSEFKRNSPGLGTMVLWFPTPQSNDAKNAVVRHRTKSRQVMLNGAIATNNPKLIGGELNPTWVEWLMGWPLGWTDLKPLETDKFHFVPQQLGDC